MSDVDTHDDLPDRIAAAAALNRLAHALVRHRADPAVLATIAREADRLAASIEDEPVRERLMELSRHPHFEEAMQGHVDELVEGGAFMDAFSDSPVSGSANPLAVGLRIGADGETALGRVTLGPGWQGAPGRSHGGVVSALIDEVYGAVLPLLGAIAFTGELTVRYVAPCPLGVPLEFRAWKVGEERRKLFLECEGRSDEGVFATSHATFITVDPSHFPR